MPQNSLHVPPAQAPLKVILFWGSALLIFLGFVWLFNDILLPFVLGIVIAYLLNPLLKRFSTSGIKRGAAAALLVTVFYISLFALFIIIIPILVRESGELIERLPEYTDRIFAMMQPYTERLQRYVDVGTVEDAKNYFKDNIGKLLTISGGITGGIAAGSKAFITFLTFLVLTPLVSFFMMKEWPAMTKWTQSLIPRRHEATVNDLLDQIDKKLAGFIRGQLTVAVMLGLIYAVALSIAGLNFGFLIGIGAGILSIIPLVGSTVGLIVAVAVAWFQSGELSYVGIIAAIFIVGQIVEGNILSPKLLGDSVGLHPLWILFALMAGGALFGILGMLLAVPIASIVGVLSGFAISRYKKSSLYGPPTIEAEKDANLSDTHKDVSE